MMNRSILWVSLIAMLPTAARSQSVPACTTHFHNNSNFQWSISNFDGNGSQLLIQPNSTLSIVWGPTTKVTISGDIPNRPYVRQFQVQATGNCVTLGSQSSAGSVTLNKPGSGDVTTCSGGC